MLLVQVAQPLIEGSLGLTSWDMAWPVAFLSPSDWIMLAQQFETDVFADFRNFMTNFIESGQIWALVIGFILGYLLRSLTTYG
jgi:hypothetical protein